MILGRADTIWPDFYVHEKQPFIGEVHELTVEFGDDILTIFPFLYVDSFDPVMASQTCMQSGMVSLLNYIDSYS